MTQMQLRANVEIAHRQVVIDELRKELSAHLDELNFIVKQPLAPQDEIKVHARSVMQRGFRLALLISNANPYRNGIFQTAEKMCNAAVAGNPTDEHSLDLGATATRILEWECAQAKLDP